MKEYKTSVSAFKLDYDSIRVLYDGINPMNFKLDIDFIKLYRRRAIEKFAKHSFCGFTLIKNKI